MDELLDFLKDRYESGDQKLIHALICNTPEDCIDYLYELFIMEFDQPFGIATKELASQFYYEKMQSWVVQMKLFDPLLR